MSLAQLQIADSTLPSGTFPSLLPDFCPQGKNLEERIIKVPCCRWQNG
jgi:hypothetical protein